MSTQAFQQAREQFLSERMSGIGGSDIAALFGYGFDRSSIKVWLEKTGQTEPSAPNIAMKRGTALEPVVIEEYERATGYKVHRLPIPPSQRHFPGASIENINTGLIRHDGHRHLIYHADGFVYEGDRLVGLLECKSANLWFAVNGWGEEGTDRIPPGYNIQVQQGMLLTGLPWCDVALITGDDQFRRYRVMPNVEIAAMIVGVSTEFWTEHVEPRVEPPVDGSAAYTAYLNRRYPQHNDELEIQADEELIALAVELHRAQQQATDIGTRCEELKNKIKKRMGEASKLTGPNWWITWRTSAPSEKIDWERVASMMYQSYKQAEAPSRTMPFSDFVEPCTSTKPGVRSFRPNFRKL